MGNINKIPWYKRASYLWGGISGFILFVIALVSFYYLWLDHTRDYNKPSFVISNRKFDHSNNLLLIRPNNSFTLISDSLHIEIDGIIFPNKGIPFNDSVGQFWQIYLPNLKMPEEMSFNGYHKLRIGFAQDDLVDVGTIIFSYENHKLEKDTVIVERSPVKKEKSPFSPNIVKEIQPTDTPALLQNNSGGTNNIFGDNITNNIINEILPTITFGEIVLNKKIANKRSKKKFDIFNRAPFTEILQDTVYETIIPFSFFCKIDVNDLRIMSYVPEAFYVNIDFGGGCISYASQEQYIDEYGIWRNFIPTPKNCWYNISIYSNEPMDIPEKRIFLMWDSNIWLYPFEEPFLEHQLVLISYQGVLNHFGSKK